jgi:hypothetical protein
MRWAVYLWPGLPQLADRGSWTALAIALGAAGLLWATLLSSFVWTDLIIRQLRIIGWVLLGVGWCGAACLGAWWQRQQQAVASDPEQERFDDALDCYLKGNWIEAERLLGRLLRRDDHDVDARLMLATLLRHTRRFDEATRQLNCLVCLEGAEKWAWEIRREGELLTEARKPTNSSGEQAAAQGSNGDS